MHSFFSLLYIQINFLEKWVGKLELIYKNKYNWKYFGVGRSKIRMFVLGGGGGEGHIIIFGAARGRREYNKGHDRFFFSKMGKNESADP